ncbi:MAG: DEAD/DEAH box helicase, partial [Sphingomonadaceae bacterium]|nr:DEAD/DEAH box helicase [Sphingomonadaceae bacterium]
MKRGIAEASRPGYLSPVPPSIPPRPEQILQTVFGYASFRGPQAGIIDDVMAGRDVLAIMPTGAGKSLCYQIPALARDGTGLVVSPLIA